MGLNLHGLVRGAIAAVNPDITGQWLVSTGYTQDAAYAQIPTYADPVDVALQVQPMSAGDLQHPNMLNVQGVKRAVYMYGNAQGVVRIDAKGGDLLKFPQVQGGQAYIWLVAGVLETWTPDGLGWCKVGVVLQDETPT
jgi:hypothetical protein